MRERSLPIVLAAAVICLGGLGCNATVEEDPGPGPLQGEWRAVLSSPGGELPFGLTFDGEGAAFHNGPEAVPLSSVQLRGSRVILRMEVYDSVIDAVLAEDGQRLTGRWSRTRPEGRQDRMEFAARRGGGDRFLPQLPRPGMDSAPESVAGTWAVTFRDEDGSEPARAEFRQEGSRVTGTFLTPVGDYRFLAGDYDGGLLRLSCFDGAHAFLFRATITPEGTLEGDFWSRASYHASWSARRIDPETGDDGLPDPFDMVGLTNPDGRLHFRFPDLQGRPVSLADEAFAGRVVLVNLFGSWCPNCNDEAPLLAEWYRRYRDRGLEIVGLAYEFTGDSSRDSEMVRRFGEHHGIDYPLLLAGTSDKEAAAGTLPDLTGVVAYPTTLFIGRDGRVRKTLSGFAGPATGEHHDRLVATMEHLIEELLAEQVPPPAPGDRR
jgi:thiol-disulfide isomerase/thioredoxin